MLLSKCAVCEKWIFIKEQEASGLLVEKHRNKDTFK